MAALRAPQRGLSIPELLMAIGILAVVILTIVGVFIGGLKLMNNSKVRTAASNVGKEVLEAIEDEGGFVAIPEQETIFDGAVPAPPGRRLSALALPHHPVRQSRLRDRRRDPQRQRAESSRAGERQLGRPLGQTREDVSCGPIAGARKAPPRWS